MSILIAILIAMGLWSDSKADEKLSNSQMEQVTAIMRDNGDKVNQYALENKYIDDDGKNNIVPWWEKDIEQD